MRSPVANTPFFKKDAQPIDTNFSKKKNGQGNDEKEWQKGNCLKKWIWIMCTLGREMHGMGAR